MLALLLILTSHQAFWKEKEIHPVLKLEEKLRTGRLIHGRNSSISTSSVKSLGSKLPPHIRDGLRSLCDKEAGSSGCQPDLAHVCGNLMQVSGLQVGIHVRKQKLLKSTCCSD